MRPEAEAEHRLATPIAGIVARAAAGNRVVRDLVARITFGFEAPLDLLHRLDGTLLAAGVHAPGRECTAEGRRGLECELVGRNVLGSKGDDRIEITREIVGGLFRQREDQIDGDRIEPGGARGGERPARDARAMGAPEPAKDDVVERLHPDRDAVDSSCPKAGKSRELDRARIGLERHLGRDGRRPPRSRRGRKRRPHRVDEPRNGFGRKEGRGPAPEIDALERTLCEVAPSCRELAQQGVDVSRLHRSRQRPRRDDREVAVRTDPLTERKMKIDADPTIVARQEARGRRPTRLRSVGHPAESTAARPA